MFAESQNFEGVFRVHQARRRSLIQHVETMSRASHLPVDCVGYVNASFARHRRGRFTGANRDILRTLERAARGNCLCLVESKEFTFFSPFLSLSLSLFSSHSQQIFTTLDARDCSNYPTKYLRKLIHVDRSLSL